VTNRLKELRTLAEIPQVVLSQKSGICRERLSLAECDHVKLTEEEMAAVEAVLLPLARRRVEASPVIRELCGTVQ
jgi:hypothetical protein